MAKAKNGQPTDKAKNEGLGVKRMGDPDLVAAIRKHVGDLRLLMNEADKRKMSVNFNIGKPVGALEGGFEVIACEITQRL